MRKQHGLQHFGLSRRMKMKIRAPFYYIEDWIKRKNSLTPEEPDRLKQALLEEYKRMQRLHDISLGGCTVIRSTGDSKRGFPFVILFIAIFSGLLALMS